MTTTVTNQIFPRFSTTTLAILLSLGAVTIASPDALATEVEAITGMSEPLGLRDTDGLELSGNWARIYPTDAGGWNLFITGGDTYNVMEMDADFQVTSSRRRLVEDWPHRLVDHQIAECPDGSWLHVASANISEPNDSAYVFRYDEDFNMVCSGTIAESDPVYRYNDAPLVCTGGASVTNPMDGTATHSEGEMEQTPFIFFNESCERTHEEPHPTRPTVSGSSIIWDEAGDYFWQIRTSSEDYPVLFQLYTSWMEPADKSYSIDTLVPEGHTTQWPQAAIAVGDYYFVAHLGRSPDVTYNSDKGDLWVQVFDRDIQHIQSIQVASYTDGGGAQRPWLTQRGDELVLVYDQDLWPHMVTLTLDLEVVGLETPDEEPDEEPVADTGDVEEVEDDDPTTGQDDDSDDPTTPGDESSDGQNSSAQQASGCSTTGGPIGGTLAGLMVGLVALGGRRRR